MSFCLVSPNACSLRSNLHHVHWLSKCIDQQITEDPGNCFLIFFFSFILSESLRSFQRMVAHEHTFAYLVDSAFSSGILFRWRHSVHPGTQATSNSHRFALQKKQQLMNNQWFFTVENGFRCPLTRKFGFNRDEKLILFWRNASSSLLNSRIFYATDFPRVCGRTSVLVIGQLITLSMCEGHILFL